MSVHGARRFRILAAGAGLALAIGLSPALAQDTGPSVTQIKQTFDPASLEVAVGATVHFNNADDVTHNLQAQGPDGKKVDHGLQKPGETTDISFPTAGVYTITCRIHPRMKMQVTAR